MASFRSHAVGLARRLVGQSRTFSMFSVPHGYKHPRPAGNHLLCRVLPSTHLFTRGFRVNMEPTPNPDSMKFIPEGQVVLPKELGTGMVGNSRTISVDFCAKANKRVLCAPQHFTDPKQAGNSRLVRQLLKLKFITSVFLGPDFISVNKQEAGDWMVWRLRVVGSPPRSLK